MSNSTQNDWAKKLSSLIDDTIENRHDYKGSLAVEDDILFERLNENLKPFVTTLLADARRDEREGIARWFETDLDGEWNGKQIAKLIRSLATLKEDEVEAQLKHWGYRKGIQQTAVKAEGSALNLDKLSGS